MIDKSAYPISVDYLRSILRCDFKRGKLYWNTRSDVGKPWNGRYANKEAFTCTEKYGYKVGRINDKPYKAHRVIYALYYGEWPDVDIDHINGIPDDNRIENLRPANKSENIQNQKKRTDNTSGYKGVSFHSKSGMWRAEIQYYGKRVHLGLRATKEEAFILYMEAAKKHHKEFERAMG